MKELELRILWENEDSFEMQAKKEDSEWTSIIRMEENGHIAILWLHIQKVCLTFFTGELEAIGKEMKSEGA